MDSLIQYLQERDGRERLATILASRRYTDPSAEDFALNSRTLRLRFGEDRSRNEEDAQVVAKKPLVVCLAVPTPPLGQLFTTADDHVWDWLSQHTNGYAPEPRSLFLPGRAKGFVDGVIYEDERYGSGGQYRSTRYVAVERSGIVEMAMTERLHRPYKGRVIYFLTPLVGFIWQFLGFTTAFYQAFAQQQTFSLIVGVRATEGAWLGGFGKGWAEPLSGFTDDRPACPEPGLLIRRDALNPAMNPDELATLIRDLATQIDNAWGVRWPRCYASSRQDPAQPFAVEAFHPALGY